MTNCDVLIDSLCCMCDLDKHKKCHSCIPIQPLTNKNCLEFIGYCSDEQDPHRKLQCVDCCI